MFYSIFAFLNKIFPAQEVHAHCDIPCGIYTPQPAQTAVATIIKMTEKIQQLPLPNWQDASSVQAYENSVSRFVHVKEEHAKKGKEEILILWTDYFKSEHVATFPNLHETFWKAAKLFSKVKQEVNMEAAQELKNAVDQIAQMFARVEEAKKK